MALKRPLPSGPLLRFWHCLLKFSVWEWLHDVSFMRWRFRNSNLVSQAFGTLHLSHGILCFETCWAQVRAGPSGPIHDLFAGPPALVGGRFHDECGRCGPSNAASLESWNQWNHRWRFFLQDTSDVPAIWWNSSTSVGLAQMLVWSCDKWYEMVWWYESSSARRY